MAAAECATRTFEPQFEVCEQYQCVEKTDPYKSLKNTSHAVLQVQELIEFSVNIFNGSNGKNIPVTVKSTDTIKILSEKALKRKSDLGEIIILVFNGKPVLQEQTLCELQVKPGAIFIICFKCEGG